MRREVMNNPRHSPARPDASRCALAPRALAALAICIALLAPTPTLAQRDDLNENDPKGDAPKVATTLIGDPEPRLVEAAAEINAWIDGQADLRTVSDEPLRQALLGQIASTDGLDGLRRERRRLGLDAAADHQTLRRLGSVVAADLLVVLRVNAGTIRLEAFDVAAGAFFEGDLPFKRDEPSSWRRFIERRARAAAERAHAQADDPQHSPPPQDEVAPRASADVAPSVPRSAEGDAHLAPSSEAARAETRASMTRTGNEANEIGTIDGAPAGDDPVMRFLRRHWPYLVAGALLAGAGTVLLVTGLRSSSPAPPTLVFRPGGR